MQHNSTFDCLDDNSTLKDHGFMVNQTNTLEETTISTWEYNEYKIAISISTYYLYVFVAFGIPGTICTLITSCQMKPLTSFTIYLSILSVIDGCHLISKMIMVSLMKFEKFDCMILDARPSCFL